MHELWSPYPFAQGAPLTSLTLAPLDGASPRAQSIGAVSDPDQPNFGSVGWRKSGGCRVLER